jgi:hypothetical protein
MMYKTYLNNNELHRKQPKRVLESEEKDQQERKAYKKMTKEAKTLLKTASL